MGKPSADRSRRVAIEPPESTFSATRSPSLSSCVSTPGGERLVACYPVKAAPLRRPGARTARLKPSDSKTPCQDVPKVTPVRQPPRRRYASHQLKERFGSEAQDAAVADLVPETCASPKPGARPSGARVSSPPRRPSRQARDRALGSPPHRSRYYLLYARRASGSRRIFPGRKTAPHPSATAPSRPRERYPFEICDGSLVPGSTARSAASISCEDSVNRTTTPCSCASALDR